MAKLNTICVLLSLAANLDWLLHQFDIKNVFLNGKLEEEVFMMLPSSHAFDSFYQAQGHGPWLLQLAGTATIAKTDPSYGSFVYPSSPSTAGGPLAPGGINGGTTGGATNPIGNPTLNIPSPPGTMPLYGNGGLTPGMGSGVS